MSPRFLGYGRHRIEDDDAAAVLAVLRSDFLTQGPVVERFEAALAERVGARFAVAASSGTAALHLACLAAGMGPGQRGLTSTISFVASANAMLYCGAEATLVDIDERSVSLSPRILAAALAAEPEISVVMPVLLGGLAVDSKELRAVAQSRLLIEDAAHGLGATYLDGSPVGSCKYADMTVFSFHPVKTITTAEGGAITTNDPEFDRRLRLFRSHGIERSFERFTFPSDASDGMRRNGWYYEHQALGYNYRLSDIHAALGLAQLSKIDRFLERRRAIAQHYDRCFVDLECLKPIQAEADHRSRSGLHLYLARIDFERLRTTRAEFVGKLAAHGVGAQVHYIPIHRQPFYRQRYGLKPEAFPVAERYYNHCLSLPLHADLSDSEINRVVEAVSLVAREAT